MIQDIYNSYVVSASGLGDYNAMSKTELANGYCDADEANDEVKKNQYFSALMLRYWYKVYDFYNESKSTRLDLEDFTSWVAESLDVAFKYRRWRDPSNPLSKDPNGPDKVFNRCFFSTRKRWYTYFNKDKRKVNYICDSIDRQVEEFGDGAPAMMASHNDLQIQDSSYYVVQSYLNNGKIIEAIIIDAIAHQDTFNTKVTTISKEVDEDGEVVENKKYSSELSNRKLVKHLNEIDARYLNYFESTYSVDTGKLKDVVSKLGKTSNSKLYKYIEGTILDMRQNSEVLSLLSD